MSTHRESIRAAVEDAVDRLTRELRPGRRREVATDLREWF